MSKSKVFLFSLIQKCTRKVPTVPFFQACQIATFQLAPKLNLSEGKKECLKELLVLLKCKAAMPLLAKIKILPHV